MRASVRTSTCTYTTARSAPPPFSERNRSATAPPGNVIRTPHRNSPERARAKVHTYTTTLRNNNLAVARSPFTDHGSIETPDHSTSPLDRPSPGANELGGKKVERNPSDHQPFLASLGRGPSRVDLGWGEKNSRQTAVP